MISLEEGFKNWLYQIARWKVSNFFAKQKAGKRPPKDRARSLDKGDEGIISLDERNVVEKTEADEKREALKFILGKLSSEERDLIVLHHFEERTYKEIARIVAGEELSGEELGRMATTLRKQVSRIYDKLRNIITNEPLVMELFEI